MIGRGYPLIKRQGGKYSIYKKVIKAFPDNYENMIYVEPFVGGGSIFFNKNPSKKEIVNDSDESLIRLYRVTKKSSEELANRINGSYTSEDFEELKQLKPTSDIGKVVKYYLLIFLSLYGITRTFFRRGIRKVDKNFEFYSGRLSSAVILNKDYKQVILDYDSPNTFFYLDPPYENTGKSLSQYSDINFDELFHILSSIKGKFLLSVNSSKRILDLFKGFHILKITVLYRIKIKHVTELLISNY
jgi:DNA adenine methylase